MLLAQLRTTKTGGDDAKDKAQKRYVTATGGLFGLVPAPHFFGELVVWYGMATLSQHAVL